MAEAIKKIFLLAVSLHLFTSCLTIDARIDLSEDLSGELQYRASISTLAADLEKVNQKEPLFTFPLFKSAVDRAVLSAEGVSLVNWSESDDGTRFYADSTVGFTGLAALSLFSGMNLGSEQSGNNTVLSVSLFNFGGEEISPTVINIVNESFSDDYIQIQIVIPGSIIRVEGATFTGSTVTYRKSVSEILANPSDVQFTVEYR
ncbi:hypothetical protein [Spirochaeta isovalerica]|uniref:Lipoprotein n=1 Tax=Spirochaeta isovalerica TaxID=150 RepID=A0A841R7G2_9SPIO|nr:hypothetical protein [Spirochaeta isovalerica]MBB6478980.1 hypothetical protein [Spirochaeta isovalerica]